MAAPYYAFQDFAGADWAQRGGNFPQQSVGATINGTISTGKGRLVWLSGGNAFTFSGLALASSSFAVTDSITDGEVMVDIETPNGGGGVVAVRAASAAPFDHYQLRETVNGSPSQGFTLAYYANNSPQTFTDLRSFDPPAVTGYPVRIRYGFVGDLHFIKAWDAAGSEPAWTDNTNVMVVRDTNKLTAGGLGVGVWGLASSGQYAAFDNLAVASWNELKSFSQINIQAINSTVDATSWTALLYAKAGTVFWIAVANSKASAPTTPTVSCTGLSVGAAIATLDYDTAGSPSKRITVFTALATSDLVGAVVTVDFGGVTQTGIVAHFVPLGGADNASNSACVGTNGTDEPTTNVQTSTVSLGAFANAYDTSGTVTSCSHSAAEATPSKAGFTQFINHTYTSPANAMATQWRDGNDTTPNFNGWTTASRAGHIAAEIELRDPFTEYPKPKGIPLPSTFVRRRRPLMRSR